MEQKRFYKSLNYTLLLISGIFAAGIACLAAFNEGNTGAAIVSSAAFIMGLIEFIWSRQVPYLQITEREIIVSRYMFYRKKRFNLGNIIRIKQIRKSTMELVLANNELEKISISPLSEEDKSTLIQILEYRLDLKVERIRMSFWKSWFIECVQEQEIEWYSTGTGNNSRQSFKFLGFAAFFCVRYNISG